MLVHSETEFLVLLAAREAVDEDIPAIAGTDVLLVVVSN